MALDEALLEATSEPTIRLYTWHPPAVSIGCFQSWPDISARLPAGMTTVRRITGGGAIWHEAEWTFACVGFAGRDGFPERVTDLYAQVHGAVGRELLRGGAALASLAEDRGDRRFHREPRCFASPSSADLIAPGGGKVLGSAVRARGGRVLLHGSLKLASNPWDGPATAGCGLDERQARQALLAGLAAAFGAELVPGLITPAESAARDRLLRDRHGDPAWLMERRGLRP